MGEHVPDELTGDQKRFSQPDPHHPELAVSRYFKEVQVELRTVRNTKRGGCQAGNETAQQLRAEWIGPTTHPRICR